MGAGAQYALDIIVTIYNQLRLKTSYVFLYISYYSIGHRINCLRYVLKDTINLADNIAASDKMTFDQHPKYVPVLSSIRS